MRILAICGSLQARSGNLALLRAVRAGAPPGVEVELPDQLRRLPLFDPDLESDGREAPPAVLAWRRALAGADALLIACPEYGHSLPGALKNGIDWVISSGELYRKVVAITAAVGHESRGLRGLAALAQTLAAVEAVVAWHAPVVQGPGLGSQLERLLRALSDAVASQDAAARPGS